MGRPIAAPLADNAVASIDRLLWRRVVYPLVIMAALSAAIVAAGRYFGPSIAMDGYTADQTTREIVIGNNVLDAPANAIRFSDARRNGAARRLDLYFHWPDMSGYTSATRDDFNNVGNVKRIVFLSFGPRETARDMSARYDPIYRSLIVEPVQPGPAGVTLYDFRKGSGYLDEMLAVAPRRDDTPFVARCLTGDEAAQSLAACERDVNVGDNLTLTYRFPARLLANWRILDPTILAETRRMLKTGR